MNQNSHGAHNWGPPVILKGAPPRALPTHFENAPTAMTLELISDSGLGPCPPPFGGGYKSTAECGALRRALCVAKCIRRRLSPGCGWDIEHCTHTNLHITIKQIKIIHLNK